MIVSVFVCVPHLAAAAPERTERLDRVTGGRELLNQAEELIRNVEIAIRVADDAGRCPQSAVAKCGDEDAVARVLVDPAGIHVRDVHVACRIRDHAVRGGEGPVTRVARAPLGDVGTVRRELLHPMVLEIGDVHAVIGADGDPERDVELAVAVAWAAPLGDERAIGGVLEDLIGSAVGDVGDPAVDHDPERRRARAREVPLGDELAAVRELLDAIGVAIDHVDVAIGADGDAGGEVEVARGVPARAPLGEVVVAVGEADGGPCQRGEGERERRPTGEQGTGHGGLSGEGELDAA